MRACLDLADRSHSGLMGLPPIGPRERGARSNRGSQRGEADRPGLSVSASLRRRLRFVLSVRAFQKQASGALVMLSIVGAMAAEPALEFRAATPMASGELKLEWTAPAGNFFRIQASRDLFQWENLVTGRSAGLNSHMDTAAPFLETRFYRGCRVEETNVLTGDHLATDDGDVVIHPINHATFVLGWNDRMIYVDPVGGSTPFLGLAKADLILVTHSHSDHFSSDTIDAVRGSNAVIVAPSAVYSGLKASLKSLAVAMANGAATNLMGLNVAAVPAYNLSSSFHARGVGNGYVLTIGGCRLYVAGDTEDIPEMRAQTNIAVAWLPMNSPYTMTVSQAVSAVRAFRPRIVYPYHYRNQNGSYTDRESFKSQVIGNPGVEVRLPSWY